MSNIKTFIADIKSRRMYKNLGDYIIESNNENYPHLTFQVKSVVDYLRIIELLSKTKYKDYGPDVRFRMETYTITWKVFGFKQWTGI